MYVALSSNNPSAFSSRVIVWRHYSSTQCCTDCDLVGAAEVAPSHGKRQLSSREERVRSQFGTRKHETRRCQPLLLAASKPWRAVIVGQSFRLRHCIDFNSTPDAIDARCRISSRFHSAHSANLLARHLPLGFGNHLTVKASSCYMIVSVKLLASHPIISCLP